MGSQGKLNLELSKTTTSPLSLFAATKSPSEKIKSWSLAPEKITHAKLWFERSIEAGCFKAQLWSSSLRRHTTQAPK